MIPFLSGPMPEAVNSALSLLVAFGLGTLIGAERQYRQRTAGLRTNVLVAVGAAAFVDLGMRLEGAPRRHPHGGLRDLRRRLPRRRRDHEGGHERPRPQHRRDPVVLGGRRRLRGRRLSPGGGLRHRRGARRQHPAAAPRQRHQPRPDRREPDRGDLRGAGDGAGGGRRPRPRPPGGTPGGGAVPRRRDRGGGAGRGHRRGGGDPGGDGGGGAELDAVVAGLARMPGIEHATWSVQTAD